MKKYILASTLALSALLLPANGYAQEGAVPGAIGGAAVGAAVGGPVGAAVGGIAGAAAGAIATPPDEVRTYVLREDAPSVHVEHEVVVGSELPDAVVLYPVPKYEAYSYAVVNDRRVIVEARTRKVIQVVE